jgi:hypothetical protein
VPARPPSGRFWRAILCGQGEGPSCTTTLGNAREPRPARRPWTAGGGNRLATGARWLARGRLRRGVWGAEPSHEQARPGSPAASGGSLAATPPQPPH